MYSTSCGPVPRKIFSSISSDAFSQLIDVRHDQAKLDAARHRELERADLAVVDHGRERARALRAVVALLEQGIHALAERRQHGARPLAPEQVAAKLAFQQLDRPRQRGLRDVALLRGAREIERARDRQEISDLVHFHSNVPSDQSDLP